MSSRMYGFFIVWCTGLERCTGVIFRDVRVLIYSGVRVSICATSFLWLQPRTKSTTFFIGAVSMAINNPI